jgi:CubicO group peptidase (beta-lactamase class C family)
MFKRKLAQHSQAGTGLSKRARLWVALIMGMIIIVPGCGGTTAAPTPTAAPPPTATKAPTSTPLQSSPAYWPTNGWRTSTPEEQGIDSAKLLAALQHVQDTNMNVRSITVIRNGYIVLEAYNQPYTSDHQYQVFSVTKSVTGALMGIAINEGYIKDLKQPVLGFFPGKTFANLDKNKQALTIEDLVTMQPGLDCADDKLGSTVEASKDWVQFTLDLPMATAPGKKLVYCTAGVHLLSAILTRATGMSTDEYAWPRLFEPLGIKRADLTWWKDPQGIAIGGYGINMKPRDMAKFGYLYLNDGKWDGKQVVPADWVAASSQVHALGENNKNYGYLFWTYPTHFAAEGLGEQMIQVVKDRNMVVVMTSAIDWHKGPVVLKLLQDYIIPSATSNAPLPANPSALQALQQKISYMANPVQPVQPLPAIAKQVSGKTYIMDDNSNGWRTLRMDFKEGSPEALATIEATNGTSTITQTATLGMDNIYRVEKSPDGNTIGRKAYWDGDHTLVVRQVQSSPELEEVETRAEISADGVKIHAREVVFDTYSYDMAGTTKP